MSKKKILFVADRLSVYAGERQAGMERHQPDGAPPWREQRRAWTIAIVQGMAKLERIELGSQWIEHFDQQLEAVRGCFAVEALPLKEQMLLMRDLDQYVSALEADGGDRRRQIAVVRDLLEDMTTHPSWDPSVNGLSIVRERTEQALARMTAHEGIRVLKVEPGKAPEVISMPNTLEAFQSVVGGYIEALGLECGVCLICNEEGKLLDLPANRQVGGDVIAGTFLVTGELDGAFCSLSDEDAARYAERRRLWRRM